jgi:hypothetical protein
MTQFLEKIKLKQKMKVSQQVFYCYFGMFDIVKIRSILTKKIRASKLELKNNFKTFKHSPC